MSNKTNSKTYMVWPLCLVALIPLLMMKYTYKTNLGDYPWYHVSELTEYFLHIKMMAMIVMLIAMLLMIFIHLWMGGTFQKPTKKDLIQWIPLVGYLLLSVISTIMSENRYFGIHGISEQFEPIWVIIGYVMITFYAYQFINTEKERTIVLGFVTFTAGVVGTIGALQSVGVNLIFVCDNSEKISTATLYNPNYMGVFCVMLMPVVFSLLIEAKKWWKLVYTYVLLVLAMSLFGSQSKTGVVILAVICLIMIPFYRYKIKKHKIVAAIILAAVVVASVGLIAYRGSGFVRQLTSVFMFEKNTHVGVKDIETSKDDVEVDYEGHIIKISINWDAQSLEELMLFNDENGNKIEYLRYRDLFYIQGKIGSKLLVVASMFDEKYQGFTLIESGVGEWDFIWNTEKNKYQYYLGDDVAVNLKKNQIKVFEPLRGYEQSISGRGYIWSRTIPLLKERAILGSGADTFMLEFPNKDYVGKVKGAMSKIIISRPHNFLLQQAIQSGVLGTVLLLIALLICILRGLKNSWKKSMSQGCVTIGITFSVLAYFAMGITNDSMIVVAPVFWLLLGLVISQNKKISEESEKEK